MTGSGWAWNTRHVLVAGLGVSGPPVARALIARGADVLAVDGRDDAPRRDLAAELERDGVRVRLGDGATLPERVDLVVISPGWRPDAPLPTAAAERGVPVIGDVELAWWLRPTLPDGTRQRWLAVTGTNGKTTTVKMLEAMLRSAGRRAIAAGNVGTPLVQVVLADDPYEVVAVELSSFQLHWSVPPESPPSAEALRAADLPTRLPPPPSAEALRAADLPRPVAATVLNVAADHLDWHGSLEAYAEDKGRIYPAGGLAVANADDAWSTELARRASGRAARVVSFTLGTPRAGQLGVVEDLLVDRAFVAEPMYEAVELATLADVVPAAPHNVTDALAAAALARADGVGPHAVRDGLRAFLPEPHRISPVASIADVAYIDDSKATNPHAAAASLAAYPTIVWVAGGQLKGASVDDLVAAAADRLRGVVALGADRRILIDAVTRHAPNVPIVEVPDTDTGVMQRVVHEASRLARPGDTVLLAPAAASLDMFASYGARGDAFATAVRGLHPDGAPRRNGPARPGD